MGPNAPLNVQRIGLHRGRGTEYGQRVIPRGEHDHLQGHGLEAVLFLVASEMKQEVPIFRQIDLRDDPGRRDLISGRHIDQ
jgi:hypothetical protein